VSVLESKNGTKIPDKQEQLQRVRDARQSHEPGQIGQNKSENLSQDKGP
jgi:hypothetical protein